MLDTAAYCRRDTVTQSLVTTLHSLRWSPGTNTVQDTILMVTSLGEALSFLFQNALFL